MTEGAAPVLGHVLPVGTRLSDYEIEGLIGEGGFGIVYRATDHSLDRRVAIKEYVPAAIASRVSHSAAIVVKSERHAETFRAGLRSFLNEARLLARFDHPALVKVYRYWEANGTAYMVMPFYEGPTLKAALADLGRPPTEDELLAWLAPLVDALAVLHASHCFHRDIAPDNILLTRRGPLLLDFGAARRVIGDLTHALTVVLKPGFAPIEQYGETRSMAQGAWTDFYALASVVRFAITGTPPVSAVERLMDDRLEPLAELARGRYSARFLEGIDRALAVRPNARPQDADAFRAALGLATAAPSAVVTVPSALDDGAAPGERQDGPDAPTWAPTAPAQERDDRTVPAPTARLDPTPAVPWKPRRTDAPVAPAAVDPPRAEIGAEGGTVAPIASHWEAAPVAEAALGARRRSRSPWPWVAAGAVVLLVGGLVAVLDRASHRAMPDASPASISRSEPSTPPPIAPVSTRAPTAAQSSVFGGSPAEGSRSEKGSSVPNAPPVASPAETAATPSTAPKPTPFEPAPRDATTATAPAPAARVPPAPPPADATARTAPPRSDPPPAAPTKAPATVAPRLRTPPEPARADVEPAPAPTSRRAPQPPSESPSERPARASAGERCSDILRKGSLEPLTAEESAYLRSACR